MLTRQKKRLSEEENQQQQTPAPSPSLTRSFLKFISNSADSFQSPAKSHPDPTEDMTRSTKKSRPLNDSFISSTPVRPTKKSSLLSPTPKHSTSKKKSVFNTIFSPVFKLLSPRADSPSLLQEIAKAEADAALDKAEQPPACSQQPAACSEQPDEQEEVQVVDVEVSSEKVEVRHEYVRSIDTTDTCFMEMAEFLR